jgi:hypothetical protein
MNHLFCLFVIVLFVLLTPNVLLRLPPKGGKWTVAIVHGLVFAFILHFSYMYYFKSREGAETMPTTMPTASGMPTTMPTASGMPTTMPTTIPTASGMPTTMPTGTVKPPAKKGMM